MLRVLWSRSRAGPVSVGRRGARTRMKVLVGRTFCFFVVVVVADGIDGEDGRLLSAVNCFDETLNDDR